MILSGNGKKPKIHPGVYVAPSATISGNVTIGSGCAILHGAVIVSEGAPVIVGSDTVVMEHAVLRGSGGSALQFPLEIGDRCIFGPHAYVVGATIGEGCFIASGAKVFNGARIEDSCGVLLGAIVYVSARLLSGATVPAQHIAAGDPAAIYDPASAAGLSEFESFYQTVFNLVPSDDVRARAAQTYAKFLRKTHAGDAAIEDHRAASPAQRRSGEEPPRTQATEVDKVVDVMMFELEEMEQRRREAIKRQKRP